MKLKIFSDRQFLPKALTHECFFFPFWGDPVRNNPDFPSGSSWTGSFNRYMEIGDSFFEMTSLEDADLVVFPGNLEHVYSDEYKTLAITLAKQAKAAGKLTAGFFFGDCSEKELPIPCDIVFRNSLYASTRRASDFAYPAWSVDFAEKYLNNELPIRQKSTKPVVGFCGFLGQENFKFYIKNFLYQLKKTIGQGFPPPPHVGHLLRKKALSLMEKSDLIETNFTMRDKMGLFSQPLEACEDYRKTYVQNIVESDYLFCCRGYGNYSFRLFETLSCGKIPVLLNTDCVFPFDFDVNWKQYCVLVDESELPKIAERIAEFHDKLSPQDFVDLQYACRKFWEERLSPEGFFENLYRHLFLLK